MFAVDVMSVHSGAGEHRRTRAVLFTKLPCKEIPFVDEVTPTPGVQELAFSSEELAVRVDGVMQEVMDASHSVPVICTPTYRISSHRGSLVPA